MATDDTNLGKVHSRLGYHYLSRGWAKAEMVFGLGSAGLGMLLGAWAASRPAIDLVWMGAALGLFVLGWYLTLSGHRSHLYQSTNDQTALLMDEICRGRPPTSEVHKPGN